MDQSASSMPLTLYTGAQDPPTQLHGKEVVIWDSMYVCMYVLRLLDYHLNNNYKVSISETILLEVLLEMVVD